MGIELPSELAAVAARAGVSWPQADEDALRASARAWRQAGAQVTSLAADADGAAHGALTAMQGTAATAATQHWNTFVRPDTGHLTATAAGCRQAADRLDHAADQVGSAKVQIVSHLVNLARTSDAAQVAAAAGHPAALAGLDTSTRATAADVAQVHDNLARSIRLDQSPPGHSGPAPAAGSPSGAHAAAHPSGGDGSAGAGNAGFVTAPNLATPAGAAGSPEVAALTGGAGLPAHAAHAVAAATAVGGGPIGAVGYGPGGGTAAAHPVWSGQHAQPAEPDAGPATPALGHPVVGHDPAAATGPIPIAEGPGGHGSSAGWHDSAPTPPLGQTVQQSAAPVVPAPPAPPHGVGPVSAVAGSPGGHVAEPGPAPVGPVGGSGDFGLAGGGAPGGGFGTGGGGGGAGAGFGGATSAGGGTGGSASGASGAAVAAGGGANSGAASGAASGARSDVGGGGSAVAGGPADRSGVASGGGGGGGVAAVAVPGSPGAAPKAVVQSASGGAVPGPGGRRPGETELALFLVYLFPLGHLPVATSRPARQLPPPPADTDYAAGLRFPPADHPDAHLVDTGWTGRSAAGPPSPGSAADSPAVAALLTGYDPLGDDHERDWDRRFLVRAGRAGGPAAEYAWPPGEQFPEGGCDTGEAVVLPPGTVIDRFGPPEGRVFAADRAAFAHRSLPPTHLDLGYRRYRVVRALPVWRTLSAAWFGQPGGAPRYRAGQAAADLVALGYLVEVTEPVTANGSGSGVHG